MGRRYDPAKISGAPHKSTPGAGGPFTKNTAKGSGIAGPGTNSRPRQSYSYRSAPNDPPPRGLGRKAGTTAGQQNPGPGGGSCSSTLSSTLKRKRYPVAAGSPYPSPSACTLWA